MNTDWQVKPLSRKSSISGETFAPGTKVICYIFTEENRPNELLRIDILQDESANFPPPKNLLARWTRIVKNNEDDSQKQTLKESLNNAEDFFLSLYHNPIDHNPNPSLETQNILKQLLALMLERKRILRRLKNKNRDLILYLHISTKKEYQVPQITLNLEEITKIQEQLAILIH